MDVMTRRIVRRFLGLLLIFALCLGALPGCHVPDSDVMTTEPTETQIAPAIGATFGSALAEEDLPPMASELLQTDSLAVVSWDSDRCAITSGCTYGEVEAGMYGFAGYSLGYAEKSNLDEWFVVCPYPNCKHAIESSGCPASIDGNFVVQNERIYYAAVATQYSSLWADMMNDGYFLASVALDGSDTRVEHTFDSSGVMLNNGGAYTMCVSAEYAICCRSILNADGLYDAQAFILDEEGEHLIYSNTNDWAAGGGSAWSIYYNTFGDRMFICGIIDQTKRLPHVLTDDYKIKQLSLESLPEEGAYLQDNIYRCFRPNDGYYDINLDTREETKLEDAQLENSHAFVVLPNCILESSLMGYTSLPMQSEVEAHAMKLFDGQRWWDVELPEELLAIQGKYLDVEAVTSDRILFCLRGGDDPMNLGHVLYQIFLGTDRPVMEYAGTVEYQELPESW